MNRQVLLSQLRESTVSNKEKRSYKHLENSREFFAGGNSDICNYRLLRLVFQQCAVRFVLQNSRRENRLGALRELAKLYLAKCAPQQESEANPTRQGRRKRGIASDELMIVICLSSKTSWKYATPRANQLCKLACISVALLPIKFQISE